MRWTDGVVQVDEEKYDIVREYSVVAWPGGAEVPYPCDELPMVVRVCAWGDGGRRSRTRGVRTRTPLAGGAAGRSLRRRLA